MQAFIPRTEFALIQAAGRAAFAFDLMRLGKPCEVEWIRECANLLMDYANGSACIRHAVYFFFKDELNTGDTEGDFRHAIHMFVHRLLENEDCTDIPTLEKLRDDCLRLSNGLG